MAFCLHAFPMRIENTLESLSGCETPGMENQLYSIFLEKKKKKETNLHIFKCYSRVNCICMCGNQNFTRYCGRELTLSFLGIECFFFLFLKKKIRKGNETNAWETKIT